VIFYTQKAFAARTMASTNYFLFRDGYNILTPTGIFRCFLVLMIIHCTVYKAYYFWFLYTGQLFVNENVYLRQTSPSGIKSRRAPVWYHCTLIIIILIKKEKNNPDLYPDRYESLYHRRRRRRKKSVYITFVRNKNRHDP